MLHKFKVPFEKLIQPICYPFIKFRISPNWITVLGLACIVGCAYGFAVRAYHTAIAFGIVGGILDGVDGKVARDTNQMSRFGAFLDSTLDRFSEIAIGLGILFSYRGTLLFEIAAFVIFVGITGSLMTSYVRARGEGIGFDPKGGILQRADRGVVLLVCALISHKALLIGAGVIAGVGYATVLQRIYLVWKGTKRTAAGN